MLKKTTLLLAILSFSSLVAQEVWTLEQCINHALSNNINIKQGELSTYSAKNTVIQNAMNMYTPLINANASQSFNFANSINPLTYQFVQQNTNSTSFSLVVNYSLFEGLSRMFTYKASKENLNATQLEQQALENSTTVLIINNYLNALLAKEALKIAVNTKSLTDNQLSRTIELVDAGVLAKSNKYEVEAQLANDELAVVNAQNNYENALNQLRLLLQLEPTNQLDVAEIEFNQEGERQLKEYNVNTVIANAFDKLPDMKSLALRKKAAELQLRAAKGSFSPSLSFSAFLGTNYFSAAQEQTGTNSTVTPVGFVSTTNDPVLTVFESPILSDKTFGNQIADNFNQNVQFALSIPIFGKWQRVTALNNAKLNTTKSEFDIKSKENTLKQDVYNAYTNYTAAIKQLNASKNSMAASKIAYDFGLERFNVGNIDSYEFETIKNRLISAQASYVQAQYDLYFKDIILSYYNTGTFNY